MLLKRQQNCQMELIHPDIFTVTLSAYIPVRECRWSQLNELFLGNVSITIFR